MHVHTRACLSATCVHAWIQEFSPGWWAVRAQLSPQLILQWGTNVYFKETIIFPESKQGGGVKNVRRSNLFQGDGAQLLFSIELVVFQGVLDSLYPLWIRALPMCTCLFVWPFKVTKNEARSKFFKGIGVYGN